MWLRHMAHLFFRLRFRLRTCLGWKKFVSLKTCNVSCVFGDIAIEITDAPPRFHLISSLTWAAATAVVRLCTDFSAWSDEGFLGAVFHVFIFTYERDLIKWKNYSDEVNSWEPVENLNCQEAIDEFEVGVNQCGIDSTFCMKFFRSPQKWKVHTRVHQERRLSVPPYFKELNDAAEVTEQRFR